MHGPTHLATKHILLVPHVLFLFKSGHLTLISFNLVLKLFVCYPSFIHSVQVACFHVYVVLEIPRTYFYFNLVLKISFVVLDFSNLLSYILTHFLYVV
jgi:hypothetical protein